MSEPFINQTTRNTQVHTHDNYLLLRLILSSTYAFSLSFAFVFFEVEIEEWMNEWSEEGRAKPVRCLNLIKQQEHYLQPLLYGGHMYNNSSRKWRRGNAVWYQVHKLIIIYLRWRIINSRSCYNISQWKQREFLLTTISAMQMPTIFTWTQLKW